MKKENKALKQFWKGIIFENPVFVLVIGLCPTLAMTNSAINGFSMGLATLFVLTLSNSLVSAFKSLIPDKVRIPAYMIIIATAVTFIGMVMEAYFPIIYTSLGIFIPLIVANCLILGRAELFASKNNVFMSALDGFSMGLGFTLALTGIGIIREILGAGTIFNLHLFGPHFQPALIFILPPGAFLTIGCIMAIIAKITKKSKMEAIH